LVVHGEDHTLGNSFRYVLAKNRNVDFVGYSIPHPSEMKLNMRIQTKSQESTQHTQACGHARHACGSAGGQVRTTAIRMRRLQALASPAHAGPCASHGLIRHVFLAACCCRSGMPVTDVLIESTDTLSSICDHVLDTFNEAEKRYRKQHPPIAAAASKSSKKKSTDDMEE
jgi:DNA-directed RNA polymerase subunit L